MNADDLEALARSMCRWCREGTPRFFNAEGTTPRWRHRYAVGTNHEQVVVCDADPLLDDPR